jgi:hypothetical protein
MATSLSDSIANETAGLDPRRQAILHELVETASTAASRQLEGFSTRLSEALLRTAQSTSNPTEARLAANASALLKKNRYPFCFVAGERISAALQREVAMLAGFDAGLPDTGALKTLPSEIEVDKKLCLIKTSRALESDHAERLTALCVRLAHLLGREQLPVAENPFRPQIFLSAIHDAWCEFQPDPAAHHLVYPLLQPDLCLGIGSILHGLNSLLVKRAILPTLTVVPQAPAAAPVAAEEPAEDPVAEQLRRLFPAPAQPVAQAADRPLEGALPTLFQDEIVQATAARNELLAHIALVQRTGAGPQVLGAQSAAEGMSLLAHIRATAPIDARSPENERTLDLLVRIFGAVFGDQNMAPEMRTLIGSLQIPVLKATLKDKDFFFRQNHPVRRVIELLARLAAGWDRRNGPADPLYQTILRNVKCIQSDQRIAAFNDVLGDLEAFIAHEESEETQALSSSIMSAIKYEKLQVAQKEAQHQVALRIGTGEVVAFVETFLEDKWTSVLTLAYSVKDDKPQAADSAVKTMDDLCWSVKPKITMEERKDLIARLPGIITMLNKWLDAIKWNEPARVKFFEDLAKCHASIVRAPIEMSPERQLQIAVAVAKKAAERRLSRQAARPPQPVPDQYDEQVRALDRGAWLRFAVNDNQSMKAKLAWASPMHSYFIFSTREKVEALSMSDEELAKALREGRAEVLAMPNLVGRALAQAVGANSVAVAAAA